MHVVRVGVGPANIINCNKILFVEVFCFTIFLLCAYTRIGDYFDSLMRGVDAW